MPFFKINRGNRTTLPLFHGYGMNFSLNLRCSSHDMYRSINQFPNKNPGSPAPIKPGLMRSTGSTWLSEKEKNIRYKIARPFGINIYTNGSGKILRMRNKITINTLIIN